MTNLLTESEIRGIDATGYWATEAGPQGKILYHKEPMMASSFVRTGIWNSLSDRRMNLMLAHARGASQGVGHPHFNQNNHPFVSSDFTIGLVHNGRVPDQEYQALKHKYQVQTQCDSEIILRIMEANDLTCETQEDYDDPAEWNLSRRLHAVKNVWSQIVKGHMVVGAGEWLPDGNRRLWLFRNKFRPLWLIDLREHLGQVFFCSTPEIWQSASNASKGMRGLLKKKIKLIEVPTEQVWVMRVSDSEPCITNSQIRKFEVQTESIQAIDYSGDLVLIPQNRSPVEVVTGLGVNDVVLNPSVLPETKKKEEMPVISPRHDRIQQYSSWSQMLQGFLTPEEIKAAELDFVDFGVIDPKIKTLLSQGLPVSYTYIQPPTSGFSDDYSPPPEQNAFENNPSLMNEVQDLLKVLADTISDLEVVYWNKKQENSLSPSDVEELKEAVVRAEEELTQCLRIVNR
jgi:hypothetical protein